MYSPSLKEFLKLSRKGNLIPVYKEINADLDTPVSALLKIKTGDYAFLLESVEGQEKIARYSFLGTRPSLVFNSKARNIQIEDLRKNTLRRFVTSADPLDEIKNIMQRFRPVEIKGLPRFYGGLVGYIGYDMARFFEKLPDKNKDDLRLPDCVFILTENLLVFDHVNHTIKIVANVMLPPKKGGLSVAMKSRFYNKAIEQIESIHRQICRPLLSQGLETKVPLHKIKVSSNFTRQEFCKIVNKAKEHIKKGDIIQVVLSQRFQAKVRKQPLDIYRRLRSLNPSPYLFFLKLKNFSLVGSSPEMLVRCEDGVVQTMPIAGTRRRGKTKEEDRKLAKELLNDKKERAEHLMLVDLGRNDLGRVSKIGQVKVTEFMRVERYSHVMHLVSEVVGRLGSRFDCYDVLRAAFPAGTVSGSPKIRAMEIVDTLENLRRSTYAGCVGYFSFSGNLDTCITLRTVLIKDNLAYIQAGAGIVADSRPDKEYQESVNKARAMIEAISD